MLFQGAYEVVKYKIPVEKIPSIPGLNVTLETDVFVPGENNNCLEIRGAMSFSMKLAPLG